MLEITYNRPEKQYEWIDNDGVIYSFPAKRKHEAFQFAVSILEPDLYTAASLIIENTPQWERIVWKAVELVIENKVEVFDTPQNGIVALVNGSDEYGRYAIQHTPMQNVCNCISFTEYPQYDQNGCMACKHTLAVRLWRVARSEF